MIQQVNLYLPEFRPQSDWLGSASMLRAIVILLIVLVLLAAWDRWRLSGVAEARAGLEASLVVLTRDTEALERQIAQQGASSQQQRELEAHQAQLRQSRDMLGFLRGVALGNNIGFSGHLVDLSRASFEGLWLTEIALRDGGQHVYLEGRAEHSAMVPDYVGRFSVGGSALRGKHFQRLLGSRRDEGYYEFVLEAH